MLELVKGFKNITKKHLTLIVNVTLCVLLIGVMFSGFRSMENEKRTTFDGSLYNVLGQQLQKKPF